MTVEECYKLAVSFIPEVPEDNVEMQKHMVNWCNILLAESVGYENIFRRINRLPELEVSPRILGEKEKIPFNEKLVSAAFPYGMARFIFRENDDISGSHEFYQLYVNALSEATPSEIAEVEDVYG